jgi:hypothetical protein
MSVYPPIYYNPGTYGGGPAQPVVGAVPAGAVGQVVKQQIDAVIYDTKYFAAGSALPTSDIVFFAVPLGQQDVIANSTAVSYTKTKIDTNLEQPAVLARGQTLTVVSVQAKCSVPGNFPLTRQGSGNTSLPLTLPTMAVTTGATAGYLASNLQAAIQTMGVITWRIGQKTFENGKIEQFPSEFGISGYAGGVSTGTAQTGVIVPNEAVANNGFGFPRVLLQPRTIVNGQTFAVILQFPVSFTPQADFSIEIGLRGQLLQDVS